MNTVAKTERVTRIRELIGPAVLLRWPLRSKGGYRKWKQLQLADMTDEYLAKLETNCNVGVALGKVSDGLVSIDFDDDQAATCFLGVNALLAETLRTRARRGCNIWIRCDGEYPVTRKLKNSNGEEIGEWRADGSQTIISGMHPEGMPYRFVIEKPVLTIRYEAIIWPSEVVGAPDATESRRVRGIGEKEVVGAGPLVCVPVILSNGCAELQAFLARNDVIAQVAPAKEHQNNSSVFKMARRIKDYETEIGRSATDGELEFAFEQWGQSAGKFWRAGLTRDDYYAEFLMAYSYARLGFKENPIQFAVARAKAAPLPESNGFKSERARLLAAICRELQKIMGGSPFFVPTRTLGEMIGAHWATIANWLRVLELKGIIQLAPGEVRKRGMKRSPRYYYGRPLEQGLL